MIRLPDRRWRLLAVVASVGLLASGSVPAAAVPSPDPLPRVAFVARSDSPFDAMSAGPVAGALGGVIVITPSTTLAPASRTALVDFNPDRVIILGGTGAVSSGVQAQIAAALPAAVIQRVAGADRHDTARLVARLPSSFGYERPILTEAGQLFGAWGNDYEGRGHDHGVAPTEGSPGGGLVNGTLAASATTGVRVLASLTVAAEHVGDECPALFTDHTFLVRASGAVSAGSAGQVGTVDVALTRDTTIFPAASDGSRRPLRLLDAGTAPDSESFATEARFTFVESATPKTFRILLQTTADTPSYAARGTLVVEHLGFSCTT
jgi:hypothetical protein